MKKQIANIVTSLRILGSIVMLFLPTFSTGFAIAYLLCGFTDMIDGTIARKTGAVSQLGASLDTIADIVVVAVCAIKVLPKACVLLRTPPKRSAWNQVVGNRL
jgi:CDP-diacylglycerol--glycerol-3-phosphate 3-phosphatidyltransferase